jgi:hypothetical protein
MKTKEVLWRYPSKVSLLKDLQEGYPRSGYLGRKVTRPIGVVKLSKSKKLTAVI